MTDIMVSMSRNFRNWLPTYGAQNSRRTKSS